MRSVLLRLAGFTGAPILSALAPFLLLPIISRVTGPGGWADFSAGQSIGILGMVVVFFGWGVVGPVRIARTTDAAGRAQILRESLVSRAITTVVAIPLVIVATALVTGGEFKVESIAMAVAMTLAGLSPSWFCIGAARPIDLMLYDAGPKLLAALAAMPVLLLGGPVLFYPIMLAVVTVAAAAAHAVRNLRGASGPRVGLGRGFRVLRELLPTAAIDAAGNAYGTTPVPIATAGLPPAQASSFASADRLYRVGVLAVIALGNAFQAWVLEPDATSPVRRHRAAILAHLGLGVFGAVGLAVLGPWASGFIFGADVAADPLTCVLFGVAFFAISSATPFIRNILIPHGRYRFVLATTLTASVVGVTIMTIGSINGHEAVVAAGVAAAELTSLLILVVPGLRLMGTPAPHPVTVQTAEVEGSPSSW
ncbi:lipopolysaccharide biosynthesis protein [Agromyces sp. Leaf222]|uniref:lipopolysaccharide biosynthesis protein n=1 Tax=Agromyces sp. Leaf222 TaxID=1735688 RepID=UPI000B0BA664|nr:polysaccharide biosynthesis protein [Agromyces sp. Leaf222]